MRRAHLVDLALLLLLAAPLFAAEPSKFTLAQSGASADPLTVLGPASVCPDNSLPRFDGASATQLQCSVLTVADTTGNLTGPSGGFSIIGGTGASDDLILDGSAGTAGSVTIGASGSITSSGNLQLSLVPPSATGLLLVGSSASDYTGSYIGYVGNMGALQLKGPVNLVTSGSGVLEQVNAASAQTYRLYGTSSSLNANYARLSLAATDGTMTIAAETAGTAADDQSIVLSPAGNGGVLYRRQVVADIDGETTTLAQSGRVWTNTGDGDGEAITLLNDPGIGVQYCFAVDVAQTITVAPSTGETLYYGTDQCVASLTSNAIGSTLCVTAITGGSGAKWFTMSHEGSWTCND